MVNEGCEEKAVAGVHLKEAEENQGHFFQKGCFLFKNSLFVFRRLAILLLVWYVFNEEMVAEVLRLSNKSARDVTRRIEVSLFGPW